MATVHQEIQRLQQKLRRHLRGLLMAWKLRLETLNFQLQRHLSLQQWNSHRRGNGGSKTKAFMRGPGGLSYAIQVWI